MNLPFFITNPPRILQAYAMAELKHREAENIRKFTQEPYIVHPVEVAEIVFTNAHAAHFELDLIEDMVCVALLHDNVEDTDTTYNEIEKAFGVNVRNGVFWLTDVTNKAQGNRRIRKELETLRLLSAPGWVKFIKLADFISNTQSIVEHDIKFAGTYLNEKKTVVDAFGAQLNTLGATNELSVNPSMLTKARASLVQSLDSISKP